MFCDSHLKRFSWLNYQYRRLTTASENIWLFDKKLKKLKHSQCLLVHVGKKHQIIELTLVLHQGGSKKLVEETDFTTLNQVQFQG